MGQRTVQHKSELADKILHNELLKYLIYEATNEQFEEYLNEK